MENRLKGDRQHRSKREANMCKKEEDAEKRRKTALA